MAIATLSLAEQQALREHGHETYLEVAVYGQDGAPVSSITVECTKCGEVLVELIGGRDEEQADRG